MSRRTALALASLVVVPLVSCSPAAMSTDSPGVCVHLANPYSEYDCPDMLALSAASMVPVPQPRTAPNAPVTDIVSVTVEVRMKSGQVIKRVMPANIDAIFFGRRAADSVLAGYYTNHGDPTKAAGVRGKTAAWPYP